MRPINRIILHCSDSPDEQDIGVKEINQWHLERGFSGIGYHFVITRDGDIRRGRPVDKIGAHVQGHNQDSIGICWVGRNLMTDYQVSAIRQCITGLFGIYPDIGIADILGHHDLDPKKTCPNVNIQWIRGMMTSNFHIMTNRSKNHLMLLTGEISDEHAELDT